MSSNRCFKLLSIMGVLLMVAACSQMSGATAPADQTVTVKSAGGACQSAAGPVADGTIASRCAMPGQGITNCPRYVCSRCTNGTWGGEYTCQLH